MAEHRFRNPSLPHFEFPDGDLGAWIAIGDVTDRSVRVWVRAPSGSTMATLVVEGQAQASVEITTDQRDDYVGGTVLELPEPQPGMPFEVAVGEETRRGTFAPKPGTRAGFTFAFGSCHQPFAEPTPEGRFEKHAGARVYPHIRRLLEERDAAFAIWLGDQVYSDSTSSVSVREKLAKDPNVTDADLLETYRLLYRGFFNESGFRELSEAVPAYLMWDDHDIFDGWGSLLDRTEFDERVFEAASRAFREYQQLRNPTGALDSRPPYGYSFWRGDVGFHVPDLRGERDFQKGQVMGKEGWARLDSFLAEASDRDVPTIFIGCSVPVVHASPALMTALERLKTSSGRDIRDRWSVPTFAAQRTMLVERLFAWQSARTERLAVVLSGDVHVGAAFSVRPKKGVGRFSQWTSSALSTPDGLKHVLANRLVTRAVRLGERELRVWRRGLATSNNVGVVQVEPAPDGGHHVTLTIHQYDEKNDRMSLGLSDVVGSG
jgi:alkaline phosphatase D